MKRRDLHRQSWIVLRTIHGHAKRWLRCWDKANPRLQDSTGFTGRTMEQSFRATEVMWAPLRQWMGPVHMRLHDLQMWERKRDGGHVQHRIHLESCRRAWARRRREFTRRQNASDTILRRGHWYRMEHLYDEAVARVVARHTYDGNDRLTPTAIPPHM